MVADVDPVAVFKAYAVVHGTLNWAFVSILFSHRALEVLTLLSSTFCVKHINR